MLRTALMCLVMLLGTTVRSSRAIESKVSVKIWNRYTAELEDGEVTKNHFSVERGYLRLEPKITNNIKGRFNLDFFSDNKGEYPDGAGIKIKYAYLDFKKVVRGLPDLKVSAGLIKNYFGMIYDYDYIIIQKTLEDKEKVCASTDYGIAFLNYLPKGFGNLTLAVYNGEGYKKSGSGVDTNLKFAANLRLIPVAGITVGGSFTYQKEQYEVIVPIDTVTNDTSYAAALKSAVVGRVAMGMVDIWGEYLMSMAGDDAVSLQSGFTIMPVIKLGKLLPVDIDLVGRFDNWDKDDDAKSHTRMTAGFNWILERDSRGGPAVMTQFNWEREQSKQDGADPVDQFLVQLMWKFSNKI